MSTKSKSTKSKTDNSSEKYLDNLLNSIYGTDDGKGDSLVDQSAFLEQFENELENETYDEYLSEFEKELGDDDAKAAGRAMDIQTPAPDDKDESLDEVLSDFDRKMKEQEDLPDDSRTSAGEQSVDIEKKNLQQAVENFEPVIEENNEADMKPEELKMVDEIGEPDLAGNASNDLLDILDSDDLNNIGELLEGKTDDTGDDIESYAKSQMQSRETSEGEDKDKQDKKADKKKSGFLKKIIAFFTKEPGEDIEAVANGAEADAKTLSDENQQILDELEAAEKKEKAKNKKKEKKEKRPKKEKKPKEKKEKKPKAPKEKKERTKWEKGPKLPKGPVIVICILVASLVVLILISTALFGNDSKLKDAQDTYNQAIADVGQNKTESIELYTQAYSSLSGLKLKGEDEKLYNKLSVLAAVSGKYDAYKSFSDSGYVTMAADSLVCAAGRCAENADNAKEYGCETQLEQLKNIISDTLSSQYGLSYDDAIALYNIDDRDDYTLALTQKLNELGIKEETK